MAGPGAVREVQMRRGRDCRIAAFQAMGSPCEILIESGSDAEIGRLGDIAACEAWRIEDKFSRYLDGNIVARINSAAGKPVEVDVETAALLDFSATLHELSEGRFDITSGVLREVWRFDGSDRVPSDDAVAAVLGRVGWQRADWRAPTLRLEPGLEIDLGGIGKEYATDRVAALVRNASSCGSLVNLGGDIAVARQRTDNKPWKVGIESVVSPGADTMIELGAGALATSGDARRFLVKDGVRYGHILDPTTGCPVADAPRSVTVAADSCTQAGMLSTLAMLKGADAEDFLVGEGVQHWCRWP
jgi:thiamine biosynthesis lipoprotein